MRSRQETAVAAGKETVELGDVKRELSSARDRLEKNQKFLDEAKLRGELQYLEGLSSQEDFWGDAAAARKVLSNLNRCCPFFGDSHSSLV